MAENWLCPFCDHFAVVFEGGDGTMSRFLHRFVTKKYGWQYISGISIECPNVQCQEYALVVKRGDTVFIGGIPTEQKASSAWSLIPESDAKPFPDYIPQVLRDDYKEACLIRDLSPKASATLSRRCLQGMIRDFWKISKARLIDEIAALEEKIDAESWAAIDSVRQVGNIGAHMEKDINLVIDVDPGEAQLLIELLETLFEEWYVARHNREEKMNKIKAIAEGKKAQKLIS